MPRIVRPDLTLAILALFATPATAVPITSGVPTSSWSTQPGAFRSDFAAYSETSINFGYSLVPPVDPNSSQLVYSNLPFEQTMTFSQVEPIGPSFPYGAESWIHISGILNGDTYHGGLTATVADVTFHDLPPLLQGLETGSQHLQLTTEYDGSRLSIYANLVPQTVPEPTTWAAWSLVALGGLAARRRRTIVATV